MCATPCYDLLIGASPCRRDVQLGVVSIKEARACLHLCCVSVAVARPRLHRNRGLHFHLGSDAGIAVTASLAPTWRGFARQLSMAPPPGALSPTWSSLFLVLVGGMLGWKLSIAPPSAAFSSTWLSLFLAPVCGMFAQALSIASPSAAVLSPWLSLFLAPVCGMFAPKLSIALPSAA